MSLADTEEKGIPGVLGKDEKLAASVPCSVYGVLLDARRIEDPFYRDNELKTTGIADHDFCFEKRFTLPERAEEADRLVLSCGCLDTLADLTLDGTPVGSADDMFRTWEYDITETVMAGGAGAEHVLRIVLHSPTKYIAAENAKIPTGGSQEAMVGYPHLRKAACMFGWDWGPRLPDEGILRDVSILAVSRARIRDTAFVQKHEVTGTGVHGNSVARVRLTARLHIEWMRGLLSDDTVKAALLVTAPNGRSYTGETQQLDALSSAQALLYGRGSVMEASVEIDDPQLWWPNGYGAQPLYKVCVLLLDAQSGSELDRSECRIGLRTVTVNTDPRPAEGFGNNEKFDPRLKGQKQDDLPGRNFAFEVNGLQIFTMGADYIPEDSLFARRSRKNSEQLLRSAAECHMNSIRIWGGGWFPDDCFYDLCDELGLLVWQDMMFACASYELDGHFEENIRQEIRDNVRRLRHHACIALWCGNNEMEAQTIDGAWHPSQKQYYDYLKIFEYIIPSVLREEDPVTFYWPSSPSSGGNFLEPQAENTGDVHYWGVWHGNEPFTAYRSHHYRFLSEFGFQSFPCLQTVESFTEPEDRNVYSRVMEMHQRNTAANGKMMNYMSQTFLYPRDFEELLYCSQLLQAEAIRYGVEHFRRFRGTCMGTVVWQLNDIWPVASWAGIDWYGRWKALQYAEKRMFEPVHISCEEHGEPDQKPYPNTQPQPVDFSADLHVANETGAPVHGTVVWTLRRPDSSPALYPGTAKQVAGRQDLEVPAYGGAWADHIDLNGVIDQERGDQMELHLEFSFVSDGQEISRGTALFCAPKHYRFADPCLHLSAEAGQLTVTAEAFAKAVAISSEDGDLRLEDNFFDMEKGTRTVRITGTAPAGAYRVRSLKVSG
jgi:beta-mannosidase